jgi:hypothetical protein
MNCSNYSGKQSSISPLNDEQLDSQSESQNSLENLYAEIIMDHAARNKEEAFEDRVFIFEEDDFDDNVS